MHTERLKEMKNTLICAVESQLWDLEKVDTKELGEAIDMIKDLEEAIYYCTVTEAMTTGSEPQWERKESQDEKHRMYYGETHYPMTRSHHPNSKEDVDWDEHDDMRVPDEREGKSYKSRKMYMEAKDMKKDKATQLRELERYMQELSNDIVEMINDASIEEKQYLEKKIQALASKIGQMK